MCTWILGQLQRKCIQILSPNIFLTFTPDFTSLTTSEGLIKEAVCAWQRPGWSLTWREYFWSSASCATSLLVKQCGNRECCTAKQTSPWGNLFDFSILLSHVCMLPHLWWSKFIQWIVCVCILLCVSQASDDYWRLASRVTAMGFPRGANLRWHGKP